MVLSGFSSELFCLFVPVWLNILREGKQKINMHGKISFPFQIKHANHIAHLNTFLCCTTTFFPASVVGAYMRQTCRVTRACTKDTQGWPNNIQINIRHINADAANGTKQFVIYFFAVQPKILPLGNRRRQKFMNESRVWPSNFFDLRIGGKGGRERNKMLRTKCMFMPILETLLSSTFCRHTHTHSKIPYTAF